MLYTTDYFANGGTYSTQDFFEGLYDEQGVVHADSSWSERA
jgi:hypothetical protein